MTERVDRVLSVYPTRTGFGWALFDGPNDPADWGVVAVGHKRNAGCLDRIEDLIDRFSPSTLVLEAFEGPSSRRKERIRKLCGDILVLAGIKNVGTRICARSDILARFEELGVKTRYEIATAIAAHFDAFAHSLPPERKIWMPEDPRMGLFNAIAVALTHYWLQDNVI